MNIMNKYNSLGLVIESTFVGAEGNFSINKDENWVKHTGDVPEYKELSGTLGNNCEVLLLQNIETGSLLKLLYPNAGRADYIIASIFVPYGLDLPGKKLFEIINVTNSQILEHKTDFTPAKIKLKKIFDEKFENIDFHKSSEINKPNKIAYRNYEEKSQLYELLDNLNQPYYSSYKAIFFIDRNSGVCCKTGDDLTEKPLIGSAIINPPQICNAFEPYIGNELFSKPIRKDIGSSLCVSWRRKGYKTIEKTTKISDANVVLEVPSKSEIKRLVPYDTIIVKDKKGNRIDQYTLMINKETILPNQNAEIVEESIFNVDVIVSANGYEQYRANKDLRNSCEVKLEKIKKTYRFIIPTTHITKCKEIEFETEKDLCESPIEGYKTTNGKVYPDYDNQLVYQPFTQKHMMILLILVLLSLCVGGCAGWFVKSYFSKSENNKFKTEIKKLESKISSLNEENKKLKSEISSAKTRNTERGNDNKPTIVQNESPANKTNKDVSKKEMSAIEYLDSKQVWNRIEMEKYPETKGLWDAMNERRFGDILKYRDNLNDSKNFIKIFKCVENNRHKTGLGKYNTTASDFDITIDTYMRKLDGAPEPKKENKVKENKEDKKTTETNNAASYV